MIKCLENGIIPNVIPGDGKDGYEIEIEYRNNDPGIYEIRRKLLARLFMPDRFRMAQRCD